MSIVIAGNGFVGRAVAHALNPTTQLHIVDPLYNTNTIADAPHLEGVIICVGTPGTSTGDCDDSQVRAVVGQVPVSVPVLIKSTMRPDQLDQLERDFPDHSICYSPEFLRAATSNADFLNQTYMVIGGLDPEGFWQSMFRVSLPKCKVYFSCSITEASVIKYTTNTFLATKIAFFNQIYDICQQNGADYDIVRQIVTSDARIGGSHTLVPGFDGQRGFGGACFPKDTNAFIQYADDLNKPITVLEETVKYNTKVRQNP